MRSIYIILLPLFLNSFISRGQLIINEVSQGDGGTKEYAELVVVGKRTCTDSCADLRGWIIDDNNGWLGSGSGQGIATGCMRFSQDNNWACVPYGSIILIYNDGDKNTSITLPDDPTDANNDHVYIVPASSLLFEKHSSSPVSPSSPTYAYPTTGFSAGGSWSGLGLSNSGDAIILTAPANLGAPYFSVGFGTNLNNPGNASVHFTTAGEKKVYRLTGGSQYNNAAAWSVGDAPADETPGTPNSPANRQWIEDMRNSGANTETEIHACIPPGGSYNFNGSTLSAPGIYTATFPISAGCDSLVKLHLSVITPVHETRTAGGCGEVVHNGITYTASTAINDTIRSGGGCDSVYLTIDIVVDNTIPVTGTEDLKGCGMIHYKGAEFRSSGSVNDTLRSIYGCDSVYLTVNLSVLETPELTVTPDTTICTGQSITLNVSGAPHVNWQGLGANASVTVSPEKTTTYRVWGQNENGCKDTVSVTVTVETFDFHLTANTTRAVAGDRLQVQTSGSQPYEVTSWLPVEYFTQQTEKRQEFIASENLEMIIATAISDNGCPDADTLYLDVLPDIPELYIPTAFTPNGDGLNDEFMIVGNYPVDRFHILIYNRWGERVFESNNIQNSWNGLIKNQPAETGVYFYILEATVRLFDETRSVMQKGDVTLIR